MPLPGTGTTTANAARPNDTQESKAAAGAAALRLALRDRAQFDMVGDISPSTRVGSSGRGMVQRPQHPQLFDQKPLTAMGPGSERLTGYYENTCVHQVMQESPVSGGRAWSISGANVW